jgi:hypothetical protein
MRVQEKQQKQFAFIGLEGGFELNISMEMTYLTRYFQQIPVRS